MDLLGWKVVAVPGVEADDVIARWPTRPAQGISHLQRRQGPEPAGQRAHHHHRHHERQAPRRGADVTAEFGVPRQMVDYQGLVGDAVDNVPGVTRSARKPPPSGWNEHGSLDGLIANADAIKGRGRQQPARPLPAANWP